MESIAHLRNLRMAPRKITVVVALVRGMPVAKAISTLQFTRRAAAAPVKKLIESAMANATDLSKGAIDIDRLWVKMISVDQGPTGRRYMPRAMGAPPHQQETSHIRRAVRRSLKAKK